MSSENARRKEFTASHKNELYSVDRSLVQFARDFEKVGYPPKRTSGNSLNGVVVNKSKIRTKTNN